MSTFVSENAVLQSAIGTTWEQGFVAEFWLTPETNFADWTVAFQFDGEIYDLWNAQILSRNGDRYVIGPVDYNAAIADGSTAIFGFTAEGAPEELTPIAIEGTVDASEVDAEGGPTVSVSDAFLSDDRETVTFKVALSSTTDEDVYVKYRIDAQGGASQVGDLLIPAGVASIETTTPFAGDLAENGSSEMTVRLETAQNATVDESSSETDVDTTTAAGRGLVVTAAPATEAEKAPAEHLLPEGPLSTSGRDIVDETGAPVQIRAINWFGAETELYAPHGLWERDLEAMMDQMASDGFNAIRLPYSVQAVLENPTVDAVDANPDLEGLRSLDVIDRVVEYAEEIGLKIILDSHRTWAGDGANESGLWYEGAYAEADWIAAWEIMATRYGDSPAVIGADLFNEPHSSATWGGGGATDWAAAAERAGEAVLDIAPHWLMIVEGVGAYNDEPYWWGGNLKGVADRPVEFSVPNKLVYSPHDYPASVKAQSWFFDGSSLHTVFREHWGYIYEQGLAPIFLGEFGSKLQQQEDFAWADAIVGYLSGDFDGDGADDLGPNAFGPSFAWWSWNPNSGDTGGWLNDDWTTVRQNAADLLAPLLDGDASLAPSLSADDDVTLTFELSLAEPAAEEVSFEFRTEDGDAVADVDYAATSGAVTFAPGQRTATVEVVVFADDETEGEETVYLVVTDASGSENRIEGVIRDSAWTEPPNVLTASDDVLDIWAAAPARLQEAKRTVKEIETTVQTERDATDAAGVHGLSAAMILFGDDVL